MDRDTLVNELELVDHWRDKLVVTSNNNTGLTTFKIRGGSHNLDGMVSLSADQTVELGTWLINKAYPHTLPVRKS